MKGWIYHVECPEDWSNTGKGRNYQILDAPHVMAMNKNPKWACAECGSVISGVGFDPPEECLSCKALEVIVETGLFLKKFKEANRRAKKSRLFFGNVGPFKRDSTIWDER